MEGKRSNSFNEQGYSGLIQAICALSIADYTALYSEWIKKPDDVLYKRLKDEESYILNGYWFKVLYSSDEREKLLEMIDSKVEECYIYKYDRGWKKV